MIRGNHRPPVIKLLIGSAAHRAKIRRGRGGEKGDSNQGQICIQWEDGDIHFYRGSFTSHRDYKLVFVGRTPRGTKGALHSQPPGKNTVNECSTFLPRIVVIRVWIFENAATPFEYIYLEIFEQFWKEKKERLCKLSSVWIYGLIYDGKGDL